MKKILQWGLLAGLAALVSLAALAKYNGEERGRPLLPTQVSAKWQSECGGCHLAFAPGLLPAASWQKVMAGLAQHFGTDASVAAQDAAEIGNFLKQNASNRWSAASAPLRITETVWFRSKHNSHEIAPAVWQRAAIKSPANCSACHSAAAQGDFNEHSIRIPK